MRQTAQKMGKVLGVAVSILLASAIMPLPALAEPILQRIERRGEIRAGAWRDAKPFGYVNEKGEWVGYAIDIMSVIKNQVEQALGKPIKLELVEVNIQNSLDHVRDGEVDISCGPISFTWNRERYIDFSLSYFVTGTQLLVKKGTKIDSLEELRPKRIGVEENTTNEAILKVLDPNLKLVAVMGETDGFAKLERGEIDVYASDGILLEAVRRSAANPDAWEIIPSDDTLINRESYACMLPEDDSSWQDLVNYSILRAIQGYVIEDPEFSKMFEEWFGAKGVTPYPREILFDHFQGIINSVERIPKDAY